ncbi:MAG: DUF4136 domain-containing protein [Polyangiaceae bacterium]
MIRFRLGLLLALVCAACAPAVRIDTKMAPAQSVEIAKRKTYMHAIAEAAPSGGYAPGEATPAVIAQTRSSIDAVLGSKGYARQNGSADLTVRIAAGTRDLAGDSSPAVARPGASTVDNAERGIVVDILDSSNNAILFHGFAHYGADRASADPKKIRDAMGRLLAELPRSGAH